MSRWACSIRKMCMKVETQIKTLLKMLSQGIYEKEHILAMALLSAIAGESIFLNISCRVSAHQMRFSAPSQYPCLRTRIDMSVWLMVFCQRPQSCSWMRSGKQVQAFRIRCLLPLMKKYFRMGATRFICP